MTDSKAYVQWAIKQRIQELTKAIKRLATPERNKELEELKKQLSS